MQVVANCLLIPIFLNNGQSWGILFINIAFGTITIPSIYLFFNYIKHTAHKDFIVTYNSTKMVDRKSNIVVEIMSPEIERIELHQNLYPHFPLMNLSPWNFQEYFCFIDKNGKK